MSEQSTKSVKSQSAAEEDKKKKEEEEDEEEKKELQQEFSFSRVMAMNKPELGYIICKPSKTHSIISFSYNLYNLPNKSAVDFIAML